MQATTDDLILSYSNKKCLVMMAGRRKISILCGFWVPGKISMQATTDDLILSYWNKKCLVLMAGRRKISILCSM